jgi:hypothetical protein
MALTLAEQVIIVERALGERMIESALLIVRSWMNELGESNPYEEAHTAISTRYNELFTLWLTSDEAELEEQLNQLTGDLYQLSDSVYADIRIKRGLSPDMHGFNPESTNSVLNYFTHCVRFRDEDLEWFRDVLKDDKQSSIALIAVAALSRNMRECFTIDGLMALIEGMDAENETVAEQCVANVVTLLVQYDIRIDFFPQIKEAFVNKLMEMGDEGENVFVILCAVIHSTGKGKTKPEDVKLTMEMLPEELQELMRSVGADESLGSVVQWMPSSESEYLVGLMQVLPQTWLYEELVAGNAEREERLIRTAIKAGYHDMMWIRPEYSEQVYRSILRKGSKNPVEYINYAHCLLLKGDRMMAFENYRIARNLCKNVKDFYALFRPDRGELVDRGIPLEQVYLIEDKLFYN